MYILCGYRERRKNACIFEFMLMKIWSDTFFIKVDFTLITQTRVCSHPVDSTEWKWGSREYLCEDD